MTSEPQVEADLLGDDSSDYLPQTERILGADEVTDVGAVADDAMTLRDMIIGRWLWNTDGTPSAFLELKDDDTCAFLALADDSVLPIEFCTWSFDEANEQLSFMIPGDFDGEWIDMDGGSNWMARGAEPEVPLHEMVLGKWTWSTPGADNAVIDLQPLGVCEIWFGDAVHAGDYCYWGVENG